LHDNDLGIDLIAEDQFENIYAIQVKRYEKAVSYEDVVTFLDQFHKNNKIDTAIIISSSSKGPSQNLLTQINEDEKLLYIGLDNLENFNFSNFFEKNKKQSNHKKIRPYQQKAIDSVINGFDQADRGQLIMATGTGKTFTSIKIVEQLANRYFQFSNDNEYRVLYVMPTLQLLKQTLENYWDDAPLGQDNFYSLAINSDSKTTKNENNALLGFPATTSAEKLVEQYVDIKNKKKILVFFSTYQSVKIIHDAQLLGLPKFNLIIADEAHKTTGTNEKDQENKIFQQVLPDNFIQSDKRLFQTATPKVFKASAKARAEAHNMDLYAMDDEEVYGKEFYKYPLGQAIRDDYLTDYQIILSVIYDDDQRVIDLLRQMINPDDEAKINRLNVSINKQEEKRRLSPNQNEIVNAEETIANLEKDKAKIEKNISQLENDIGKFINLSKSIDSKGQDIISNKRGKVNDEQLKIKRLLAFSDTNNHSAKQVDIFKIIQKEYTKQVHLDNSPITILNADAANGGMNVSLKTKKLRQFAKDNGDNQVNFLNNVKFLTEGIDVPNLDAVVFLQPKKSQVDIVQAVGRALRKDNNNPNKKAKIIIPALLRKNSQLELDLGNSKTNLLDEIGYETLREVIYNLRDNDERLQDDLELMISVPTDYIDGPIDNTNYEISTDFLTEIADSLQTNIIEEAQTSDIYNFKKAIARYAKNTRKYLKKHLSNLDEEKNKIYQRFYNEMDSIINISESGIDFIDTITQHIALNPLLLAYFDTGVVNEFKNNSVRLAFEKFLDDIEFKRPENAEITRLTNFITRLVTGVTNPRKLQDILNSIYEVYFNADKENNINRDLKNTIKPTPSPIIDYMVNSIDEILQTEFKTNLKSKEVGILEPFVGTGTFLVHTMLYLREKLGASDEEILDKFENQLFGQELILVAYYIAASNLQVELKALTNEKYQASFDNLLMGNTFMSLDPNKFTVLNFGYLDLNIEKLKRQYDSPIKVIMGNPPYLGQAMAPYKDIQSKSLEYYKDKEVQALVNLTNATALSNTYIGALTYAIDRLKDTEQSIIAYIFPNDWLMAPTTIGIRKYLLNHFKDIYIIDLKGSNYSKDGLQGGNVFDIQQGVAIVILVKNIYYKNQAMIHYKEFADISKDEKLTWLKEHSLLNTDFKILNPDQKYNYFPNKAVLAKSIKKQIEYYNQNIVNGEFVDDKKESINFKYTRANKAIKLDSTDVVHNLKQINYRPFVKKWIYAPNPENKNSNQFIERYRAIFKNYVNGELLFVNSNNQIDQLAVKGLTDLNSLKQDKIINVSKSEDQVSADLNLFDSFESSDNNRLTKKELEDNGALIYAITHTPQYRENFDNLVQDYYKYPIINNEKVKERLIKIGWQLINLHLNYDQLDSPRYSEKHISYLNPENKNDSSYYNLEKIKYDKKDPTHKTLFFNDNIIIHDLPDQVFSYKLDGKPAIEHIMQHYALKENKSTAKSISSEVVDDPNTIDISENWQGGRYVFEILLRVIELSIQTIKLMEQLSEIQDQNDFLNLKDAKIE
jgi:predicted helicase